MSLLTLTRQSDLHILTLGSPESKANTFTQEVLDDFHRIFDEIDATSGNTALMIQSSNPKFWCAGIDLNWLESRGEKAVENFIPHFEDFGRRLGLLSCPTIAAINGHTYGGGAVMAAMCDFRFMTTNSGKFCFPEVDVKIPFTPKLIEMLTQVLGPRVFNHLALSGAALDPETAHRVGIIDKVLSIEETTDFALQMAKKDRETYKVIKAGLKDF